MTAPERIWANCDGNSQTYLADKNVNHRTEYVRADLLATSQRELAEARAEHADARDNFCTMQQAANKLRIRAEAAEARADEAELAEWATKDWFWSIANRYIEAFGPPEFPDPDLSVNWKDRATAAEARATASERQVEAMREALKPFATYLDLAAFDRDNNGQPLPDSEGMGWVYLTIGDFRRARTILNPSEKNNG